MIIITVIVIIVAYIVCKAPFLAGFVMSLKYRSLVHHPAPLLEMSLNLPEDRQKRWLIAATGGTGVIFVGSPSLLQAICW